LCCAVRDIDEEFFDLWKQKYVEAAGARVNREERLNDVYDEIETHLKLIGKSRKVEFILYGRLRTELSPLCVIVSIKHANADDGQRLA